MSVKRESTLSSSAAAASSSAAAPSSAASASSVDRKKKFPTKHIHFTEPPDADTFRILVSTDNHVGYLELDPIRKEDSFNSFREVLQAAKDNQVDFVLLGGDLFHDNKPSRATLCKTVDIMREFTFGENPIRFEIISDQKKNFPTTHIVNYEDPNFNVALPIFSIHGNHDDPSGTGSYSTMDLLHSCSLLNYFGKIDQVDSIQVSPILMTKNTSKLALYGLGNVRDERLHRTFERNGVVWDKPQNDPSSWFNLGVVHQNRNKHSVAQKDYLPEKFLPKFLDLVIWGHEHECMADPMESLEGGFVVLQPGSSVATSLSGGEAKEKQVFILEIKGDQYRTVPIPLISTRPFSITEVKLSDDLDPIDTNANQVEEYLTDKINEIITKIQRDPHYQNPERPKLPLIRLRVEHTGFPRITNINKFGQKFVGKVANPEDLVIFMKQKKAATRKKRADGTFEDDNAVDTLLHGHAGIDRDRPPPIHELVTMLIQQSKGGLHVLTENRMAEMVDDFVNKKDPHSIANGLDEAIKQMTNLMKGDPTMANAKENVKSDEIERIIKKKHDELSAVERKNTVKSEMDHRRLAETFGIDLNVEPVMREATLSETEEMEGSDGEEAKPKARSRKGAAASSSSKIGAVGAKGRASTAKAKPAAKGAGGRGRKKKVEDEDEDAEMESKDDIEDSDDGDWGVPSRKNTSRKKKIIDDDDDEYAEEEASVAAIEEFDDDERPSKKAKTKPSAASSAAPVAMTTGSKASPNPKKRGRAALALTSTAAPAQSAAAASFFAPRGRAALGGTPAPGSSQLIDLSEEPSSGARTSAAASKKAAAAAIDVDMDDEDVIADWTPMRK